MTDPGKPTVPLTGGFYGERVNAQEAARIRDQNARQGYTPPNAANPRRTVLGEGASHVAPVAQPVRLPDSLVRYVGLLVAREFEAGYDQTDTGRDQFAQKIMDALREVDVAQLKA